MKSKNCNQITKQDQIFFNFYFNCDIILPFGRFFFSYKLLTINSCHNYFSYKLLPINFFGCWLLMFKTSSTGNKNLNLNLNLNFFLKKTPKTVRSIKP